METKTLSANDAYVNYINLLYRASWAWGVATRTLGPRLSKMVIAPPPVHQSGYPSIQY